VVRVRRLAAGFAVVAAMVATGCGGPGPAPGDELQPATGPRSLVVRVTDLPGLLPPGGSAALPPAYALYGDGTLINGPAPGWQGSWPEFQERRIDTAELRTILRLASKAAPRDRSDTTGGTSSGPDAPTVRVTVITTTQRWTTTLPRSDGRLARLRTTLARGHGDPYRPAAVAVISTETSAGGAAAPVRSWPLGTLEGQVLGGTGAGSRCIVLRGTDVEAAHRLAAGTSGGTVWRSGSRRWTVAFRPLLPDEHDCSAL
jgi:hypothetical protein